VTALLIQLSASLITISSSWFYGNKSPLGPWLGLIAQVPWWTIMITGGLWGLLPVNATLLVIHARNLIKWRRDGLQAQQ
jgi:hypothetical protein